MALNKRMKAGYGAAEFGLAGGELLLQLYLLEYYIRGVGLSPMLAGIALAVAIFWDAVTDPLMGGLVDRTSTRLGRFVPYLFLGGLIFGGGLALLFNPPGADSQFILFLYLLISYMIVNTGLTIIGVPHIAMGGVLSPNTHERTELYGWRLIFGTFGLFAGILSPLIAAKALQVDVATVAGLEESRGLGSIYMGAAVVLTALITIVATWRRSVNLPAPTDSFHWKDFLANLGRILRNPVFLPFFLAFILVAMGRSMNSTLALPYYKDSLNLSESAIQGPILSVFTLVIVLSVPAWVWLGRRYGKKQPAFIGMFVLGVMSMVAYPLFPEGSVVGPVIAAVIGGFAVGAIILVESLVTDIADEDFVRNGEDREGIYFGFWRMGQKVARSITLGLTGLMLSVIGYEESLAAQSEDTDRALAWLFGLGVGSLFLAASFVFLKTPIDRERQEWIQTEKSRILAERGKS
ncbi:MFS transporter [Puniceicoccales bacterium CK1056]|uniref:MFS transporter n=1 Tax=Oceanipulchritudo coccoides TaxID=2706888 RepID=A0A6B2LY22_9BACT|nr:MFS transporter [Oceanipulchritudo coccoides]NDV60956.1 MFS transporter [Oceanipulchritudo coccoides]